MKAICLFHSYKCVKISCEVKSVQCLCHFFAKAEIEFKNEPFGSIIFWFFILVSASIQLLIKQLKISFF